MTQTFKTFILKVILTFTHTVSTSLCVDNSVTDGRLS